MLRADLENEAETIRNYRERVKQCEALGEYAIAEHIPKMCVAVDRLRRKRRRSEACRRIAEDRRGRGPDQVGDTERLRSRIEAAQRAAISRRFLV